MATHASLLPYRRDIDGLRALAVFLVVVFHAAPGFVPGGFIGVDIFFVISGFLITGILTKELNTDSFSLLRFYQRRIVRLYPAMLLVIAATLAVGWVGLTGKEYKDLGLQSTAALLFSANLLEIFQSTYSEGLTNLRPLIHFWSLGVEEQFYIFFPTIIYFLFLRRRMFQGALLILLLSFLLNVLLVKSHPSLAFYLPLTRFWELVLGSVCFFILNKSPPPRTTGYLLVLSSATLLVGTFKLDTSLPFPGFFALVPCAFAALFLITPEDHWTKSIFRSAPAVFVGKISYPMYLWHWPCLALVGSYPTRLETLASLILSTILSVVTYIWLERPIQKRSRLTANLQKKVSVYLLATSALVLGGSLIIYAGHGLPRLRLSREFTLLEEQLHWERDPEACSDWVNCHHQRELLHPPRRLVVLLGDSHAEHYAYGLREYLAKQELQLISFASIGCPALYFAEDQLKGLELIPDLSRCLTKMKEVVDNLLLAPGVKTIIISSRYSYHLKQHFPNHPDAFETGLEDMIRNIHQHKIPIILFDEVPFFPEISKCFHLRPFTIPLPDEKFCHIEKDQALARQSETRPMIMRLKEKYQLGGFDPFPILCPGETCSAKMGENTMYRDDNHLSYFGSKYFGDVYQFKF